MENEGWKINPGNPNNDRRVSYGQCMAVICKNILHAKYALCQETNILNYQRLIPHPHIITPLPLFLPQ